MAAAILKSEIADKASVKVVEAFVAMNRGLKELCKLAEINDPIHGNLPNIVMKWTGHSDYKAMKPYIDIVDSIKAQFMTKFNNLL